MEFLLGLLLVGLFVGLLIRKKGDSFTDTLQSGCGCLFVGIFILVLIIVLLLLI
jgi:hypothetical protein